MLTLRPAEASDVPMMLRLFDSAAPSLSAPLGGRLDRHHAARAFEAMVQRRSAILAEVDGEVIGGADALAVPSMFTADVICYLGIFYIAPTYRRHTSAFFRRLEQAVAMTDVTKFVVAVPETVDADAYRRFYRRLGFRMMETHMVKAVHAP